MQKNTYINTYGHHAIPKRNIDYFIANTKLSKLFLGMIVYRGSDIGADQFFSMTKLRFPPE
jgi:hypothetical protein